MDLTPYLGWLKLAHIAGAFLFVAGHGVSMFVAFRIRGERDRARLLALLDLSRASLGIAGVGLLVLLGAGIVGGIAGNWFGQGWIWVSLVVLIVLTGVMTPLAAIPFNRIRAELGQRPRGMRPDEPDPIRMSPEQVIELTDTRRPELLATIGAGGFLVILWLMIFKPF